MANTQSNQSGNKRGREVIIITIIGAVTVIIVVLINNLFGILDSSINPSEEALITMIPTLQVQYSNTLMTIFTPDFRVPLYYR